MSLAGWEFHLHWFEPKLFPLYSVNFSDRGNVPEPWPWPERIKERTLWWQFTIVHAPSKLQLAADALSRRKIKLPATIYQLRIYEPDDEEDEVADDLKNRFEHHFPEPDTRDLSPGRKC